MGLADEIRTAILNTVKAPSEVEEITNTIRSTLELITTLGRPRPEKITLYEGTPHEEVREMWLIEDYLPYGQQWLDSTGTLWHFHFGEEFNIWKVNLARLPAGLVSMYNHNVESFKASLTA